MSLIDNYRSLLIRQFYNKPKAVAETELKALFWDDYYDFLNSFAEEFDLDEASGPQLDLLGKRIGFDRHTLKFDTAGNPIGTQVLDDDTYRFFLRIKIVSNRTNACMSSDSGNSINDAINFAFKGQAHVTDNLNMSLTLHVGDISSIDTIKLALYLDLLPRGQGVRYDGVIQSNRDNFNFSDATKGKGFGTITDKTVGGTFARYVI